MRAIDDRLTLLRVDGASVPTAGVAQVRVGRMSWDESVGLRGDGREDAFLVEAGTIRAASVWRRVEAVASDLVPVRKRRTDGMTRVSLTFRRLQYRHAIAVRCLGAG